MKNVSTIGQQLNTARHNNTRTIHMNFWYELYDPWKLVVPAKCIIHITSNNPYRKEKDCEQNCLIVYASKTSTLLTKPKLLRLVVCSCKYFITVLIAGTRMLIHWEPQNMWIRKHQGYHVHGFIITEVWLQIQLSENHLTYWCLIQRINNLQTTFWNTFLSLFLYVLIQISLQSSPLRSNW